MINLGTILISSNDYVKTAIFLEEFLELDLIDKTDKYILLKDSNFNIKISKIDEASEVIDNSCLLNFSVKDNQELIEACQKIQFLNYREDFLLKPPPLPADLSGENSFTFLDKDTREWRVSIQM